MILLPNHSKAHRIVLQNGKARQNKFIFVNMISKIHLKVCFGDMEPIHFSPIKINKTKTGVS